jgi:hypothetical protein
MDPLAPRVAHRFSTVVPKVDIPSVMKLIAELKELLQKCHHWLSGADKAFKEGADGAPDGYVFPSQMKEWMDDLDSIRGAAGDLAERAWSHEASSGAGVVSDAIDNVRNCCAALSEGSALHPMRMLGKADNDARKGALVPFESRKKDFVKSFMSFLKRSDTILQKTVTQVKSFEARQKKMPAYRS